MKKNSGRRPLSIRQFTNMTKDQNGNASHDCFVYCAASAVVQMNCSNDLAVDGRILHLQLIWVTSNAVGGGFGGCFEAKMEVKRLY